MTPHLIQLTFEAALRSFWRKNALFNFLRRSHVPNLTTCGPDESKRDYLTRIFESLELTDQGNGRILQIARFLVEQRTFPDLESWEDSKEKVAAARSAVAELADYLSEQDTQMAAEESRSKARKRTQNQQALRRTSQQALESLDSRLTELTKEIGTSKAGIDFESWFYDLMEYSEITSRRPYKTGGRQIDGSITLGDTTYLVEAKFTVDQSGASDIDVFRSKVDSKADNTMGIFVSISGYSAVAKAEASGRKTPLLLLDSSHLYRVLTSVSIFSDVIERVRRHASQTSEAYLHVNDF